MTTQRYPDGTVATHPACLDDTPPRPAVDVMARIAAKTGLPDPTDELARLRFADQRASFIPAVHDVHRDAVLAAAVAWRQEGDWDKAQDAMRRLADAVDLYVGSGR